MTREEIVDVIIERLGKRTDLEDQIIVELKEVQRTKCEGHHWLPWFCITENQTVSTTADEERVPVPTDFLMEDDNQALWIVNENGKDLELKKDDLDVIKARTADTETDDSDTGQPEYYDLVGDYFILRPIPDDVYTLRLRCMSRLATLSSDSSENGWTTHATDVLIYETCAVMAREYLKDTESAEGFEARAKQAWDRLYRKHIAREEAGRMRQQGED